MKQFIIDTLSSAMSAAVVAGVLILAAAPAKADSGDIVKGLMLGLIISELNKPNTPTTHQPQVTVLRDRPNCGHFENLDYQGAYVVWTKFNACTGQVVAQEVRPRF
jgi:hypothetical protein